MDLHSALIAAFARDPPALRESDGCTAPACTSRMRWQQHMKGQLNMAQGIYTSAKLLVDPPEAIDSPSLTLRPLAEAHTHTSVAYARVALHEASSAPPD